MDTHSTCTRPESSIFKGTRDGNHLFVSSASGNRHRISSCSHNSSDESRVLKSVRISTLVAYRLNPNDTVGSGCFEDVIVDIVDEIDPLRQTCHQSRQLLFCDSRPVYRTRISLPCRSIVKVTRIVEAWQVSS